MNLRSGSPAGSSADAINDLLSVRPATQADATHLAIPSATRPDFYLPLDTSASARRACWAYNGLRPIRRRLPRAAIGLAASLWGGRGRRLVPASRLIRADRGDGSLLGCLADELGVSPLAAAIGTPRRDGWWKPTLQLFDQAGHPVGFAKIGLGALADRLVTNEHAALTSGAKPASIKVPAALAMIRWRDLAVVVTEPMPPTVRRRPDDAGAPTAAMASLWGNADPVALVGGPWWAATRRRLDAVAGTGDAAPELDRMGEILAAAATVAAGAQVVHGRWHGDWVPWNMAHDRDGTVWLWDWEYSGADVPAGTDRMHWAYQVARVLRGESVADSGTFARNSTTADLVAAGCSDDQVQVLSFVHAAELCTRAIEARSLGADLGDEIEDWLRWLAETADRL